MSSSGDDCIYIGQSFVIASFAFLSDHNDDMFKVRLKKIYIKYCKHTNLSLYIF